MIEIRRGADRATAGQPGIRSWHSFAAGAHYDAGNTSFGPVIGVDEHLLDGGAGFAEHPHRGVQILTWVLEGALRHHDADGTAVVRPGQVLVQLTGPGVRHVEENASPSAPVRFVQTTMLGDDATPRWWVGTPPVIDTVAEFDVLTSLGWMDGALVHAFVAAGSFRVNGAELGPGDSLRATEETLVAEGSGQLLVVRCDGVGDGVTGDGVTAART
jgi:quercetin 2,3-dioxygenase